MEIRRQSLLKLTLLALCLLVLPGFILGLLTGNLRPREELQFSPFAGLGISVESGSPVPRTALSDLCTPRFSIYVFFQNWRKHLVLRGFYCVPTAPLIVASDSVANTSKLKLLIRLSLLVAGDVNPNPGPSLKYPCKICSQAARWGQDCIVCENCKCNYWFHVQCLHMDVNFYNILASHPSYSWICCDCGLSNFATSLFADFKNSFEHRNKFDLMSSSVTSLDSNLVHSLPEVIDSIGTPVRSYSPCRVMQKTVPQRPRRSKGRPLKIINYKLNCQSIRSKVASFHALLDEQRPDAVVGTESWPNPNIINGEIFPSNFNIFRKDRVGDSHGGVTGVFIAVNDNHIAQEEKHLDRLDCEMKWCSIHIQGVTPLFIGAFYRSQRTDNDYLERLDDALKQIPRNASIWLLGDFNLPDVDWVTNSFVAGGRYPGPSRLMIDMASDHNFHQIVKSSTRENSTLDLCFTNDPTFVSDVQVIDGISDHDVVTVSALVKPKLVHKPSRKVFLYKSGNYEGICEDLNAFNSILTDEYMDQKDVDDIWCSFKNMVHETMETHIPSKMSNPKVKLSWMSVSMRKMCNRKRKLYDRARRSGDFELWDKFKDVRRKIDRELRKSYRDYVCRIGDILTSDNTKLIRRYVRSIQRETFGVGSLKYIMDKIVASAKEKAEALSLNAQFSLVFNVEDSRPKPVPKLSNRVLPNMPDITITIPGVEKLLKKLKVQKATGPDRIPAEILRECATSFAPILQKILQKSLTSGDIPEDWRNANIVPVFKKGERSLPANYCPVSLTRSIVCKQLEHIIANHVPDYKPSQDCIKSSDYYSWGKFAVDKEVERVDEAPGTKDTRRQAQQLNQNAPRSAGVQEKWNTEGCSAKEVETRANREKDKGNEAFRAKDYSKAIVYYSRSLSVVPSASAYNNRALARIRLEQFLSAIADCNQVLDLEPDNLKAMLRRGFAQKSLHQYEKAAKDLEYVLSVEPGNEKAEDLLKDVKKRMTHRVLPSTNPNSHSKEERMAVEGVEGSDQVVLAPVVAAPPKPLPGEVVNLKDEGNQLYKAGQYGQAKEKYTMALNILGEDEASYQSALASLYSNRSACKLELGDCQGCITDCDISLNISYNSEVYLRRGSAYETLERYNSAYLDYQQALILDHYNTTAQTAATRVVKVLQDQYGPTWRDKLPARTLISLAPRTQQPPLTSVLANWPVGNDAVPDGNTEVKAATPTREEPPAVTTGDKLAGDNEQPAKKALSKEEQFMKWKTEGNDLFKKQDQSCSNCSLISANSTVHLTNSGQTKGVQSLHNFMQKAKLNIKLGGGSKKNRTVDEASEEYLCRNFSDLSKNSYCCPPVYEFKDSGEPFDELDEQAEEGRKRPGELAEEKTVVMFHAMYRHFKVPCFIIHGYHWKGQYINAVNKLGGSQSLKVLNSEERKSLARLRNQRKKLIKLLKRDGETDLFILLPGICVIIIEVKALIHEASAVKMVKHGFSQCDDDVEFLCTTMCFKNEILVIEAVALPNHTRSFLKQWFCERCLSHIVTADDLSCVDNLHDWFNVLVRDHADQIEGKALDISTHCQLVGRLIGPASFMKIRTLQESIKNTEKQLTKDIGIAENVRQWYEWCQLTPDQLSVTFGDPQFLFLTGVPGSGKTILALAKAEEILRNESRLQRDTEVQSVLYIFTVVGKTYLNEMYRKKLENVEERKCAFHMKFVREDRRRYINLLENLLVEIQRLQRKHKGKIIHVIYDDGRESPQPGSEWERYNEKLDAAYLGYVWVIQNFDYTRQDMYLYERTYHEVSPFKTKYLERVMRMSRQNIEFANLLLGTEFKPGHAVSGPSPIFYRMRCVCFKGESSLDFSCSRCRLPRMIFLMGEALRDLKVSYKKTDQSEMTVDDIIVLEGAYFDERVLDFLNEIGVETASSYTYSKKRNGVVKIADPNAFTGCESPVVILELLNAFLGSPLQFEPLTRSLSQIILLDSGHEFSPHLEEEGHHDRQIAKLTAASKEGKVEIRVIEPPDAAYDLAENVKMFRSVESKYDIFHDIFYQN